MSDGAAQPVEWAELTALDESLRGIGMNAGMEEWDASMAEVKPEVMNPIVDAFAASTPPAGFDAAKRDAVTSGYKELITAASGDQETYKTKYEGLMTALRNLRTAAP
ncbi:MAG: hypothetical protein WKF77_30690 [Planctomycetaceae bacterium]